MLHCCAHVHWDEDVHKTELWIFILSSQSEMEPFLSSHKTLLASKAQGGVGGLVLVVSMH